MTPAEQLYNALKVITETDATANWLAVNDPKAMEQANAAMTAYEASVGPVVNGERFAKGYTPEAAAYEQATRRAGVPKNPDDEMDDFVASLAMRPLPGPETVWTGCKRCGEPVEYNEGDDDGPLYCERCSA